MEIQAAKIIKITHGIDGSENRFKFDCPFFYVCLYTLTRTKNGKLIWQQDGKRKTGIGWDYDSYEEAIHDVYKYGVVLLKGRSRRARNHYFKETDL